MSFTCPDCGTVKAESWTKCPICYQTNQIKQSNNNIAAQMQLSNQLMQRQLHAEEQRREEEERHQAEEQRKLIFSILQDLIPMLIKKKGHQWYVENYCRLLLGFEEQVSRNAATRKDWRDFFTTILSKGLSEEQVRVCHAYNQVIDAYENTNNAIAQWEHEKKKYHQRLEEKIHKTYGWIGVALMLVIMVSFWQISTWWMFFKIPVEIIIFGIGVGIAFPKLCHIGGYELDMSGKETLVKMELDAGRVFKKLVQAKFDGRALSQVITDKKQYLIDGMFEKWEQSPGLYSGDPKMELYEIRDLLETANNELKYIFDQKEEALSNNAHE